MEGKILKLNTTASSFYGDTVEEVGASTDVKYEVQIYWTSTIEDQQIIHVEEMSLKKAL